MKRVSDIIECMVNNHVKLEDAPTGTSYVIRAIKNGEIALGQSPGSIVKYWNGAIFEASRSPSLSGAIIYRVADACAARRAFSEYTGITADASISKLLNIPALVQNAPPAPAKIVNVHALKKARVIFSPPATVVQWADGDKTVVKCSDHDEFCPMRGFLTAYFEKHSGMTRSRAGKFMDKLQAQFDEEYEFVYED